MSLLLCKLRGKQLDKVRHKVLKMSHDAPSEECEICKRRTRYEVHNIASLHMDFSREKNDDVRSW